MSVGWKKQKVFFYENSTKNSPETAPGAVWKQYLTAEMARCKVLL